MPQQARWAVAVAVSFSVLVGLVFTWARDVLSFRNELKPHLGLYLSPLATQQNPVNLGKFEPSSGCILGAYIDLDPNLKRTIKMEDGRVHKVPEEFEALTEKKHGMYFFYMGYGKPFPIAWVKHLAAQDRYVHVALEPNLGISQVQNDAYLLQLAKDMKASGAKIFLRFASEMNGPWVKYHGNPALYRQTFKLMSKVMHKHAPNVAMVWCPYFQPTREIPDYYPGDDAVDWVGVNMYSVTYFNQNAKTPGQHMKPRDMLRWMYDTYSYRKPLMICEYATTHFSALEDNAAVNFAVNNITELYSDLPKEFPRVKAINYFDTNNLELSHRLNNDYTVTGNSVVLEAYKRAISSGYYLRSTLDRDSTTPDSRRGVRLDPGAQIREATQISVDPSEFLGAQYVRFYIDGGLAHEGNDATMWACRIEADEMMPGEHTLEITVLDGTRTLLHREKVRFFIAR